MRYRIQVLVNAERLPVVIEAAYHGALDYDPELKVWPATKPLPGDIVAVERPLPKPRKGRVPPVNSRQILIEAALKTGPKRWSELKTALSTGGLSESSLNNLISQWQKAGKIRRSHEGLWSLVENEQGRAATA